MSPPKPQFLIVGSAKCGTTALASVLEEHPDCCFSRPKEASFFQDNVDLERNENIARGWDWYQKFFDHFDGESIVGEGTPSYSDRSRSPKTAERIFDFNPDMKIIYMVRDPLGRQISAWKMDYAMGQEGLFPDRKELKWAKKGFTYWMGMQRDSLQWDECRYHYQVSAYTERFPASNVLVVFLEDWKNSMQEQIDRVFDFLGLSSGNCDTDVFSNRAEDRTTISPLVRGLRSNSGLRFIWNRLPKWVVDRLGFITKGKPWKYPETDLSPEIETEFLKYIRSDNLKFLKDWGKPHDFWMCHSKIDTDR